MTGVGLECRIGLANIRQFLYQWQCMENMEFWDGDGGHRGVRGFGGEGKVHTAKIRMALMASLSVSV